MRHNLVFHTSDVRNSKTPLRSAVIDLRIKNNSRKQSVSAPVAVKQPVRIKVYTEIKKSKAFELFPTREQILSEIAAIEDADRELRLCSQEKIQIPPIAEKKEEEKKSISIIEPKFVQLRPRPILVRSWVVFAIFAVFAAFSLPVVNFGLKSLALKDRLLAQAFSAYDNLNQAKDSIFGGDFYRSEINFILADKNFSQSLFEIEKLGRPLNFVLDNLPPVGGTFFSAVPLLKAGKSLASAGETVSRTAQIFANHNLLKLILTEPSQNQDELALTDLLFQAKENLKIAKTDLAEVKENLNKSSFSGFSEDIQNQVADFKDKLNPIGDILSETLNWSDVILKLLGHYRDQRYLLLFQNPGEARATGGFIGTYGLMEIERGFLKKNFINGIFDIDGQLRENIVPPRPIQRISTAWSTHDSNWFFDFPSSAKKAAWFFEKTGNPTPDHVIALTPKVIERLLEITGPIEMGEYGQTINAENFIEATQFEVELDYDKKLNKPKQFLADLFPKLLERLSTLNLEDWYGVLKILNQSLAEKDIMIFSFDEEIERFVSQRGWSGEIKQTDKDYLAVVSSNINGFKTDRVIDEVIDHNSEIQSDGSIIDTVTIKRTHQGGDLAYDWWNRVNTNYLRVYVPLGAELLSASGYTRDIYAPPIDYNQAGFKRDTDVETIEKTLRKDDASGTEIFEESGKTVFANWTYVSPGESVNVVYKYRLPFKMDLLKEQQSAGLFIQKQSGSKSVFHSVLNFPQDWKIALKYPENLQINSGQISFSRKLDQDYFYGAAFDIK